MKKAYLAMVEDVNGIRYTISYQENESNESILSRASSFYGKDVTKIIKK